MEKEIKKILSNQTKILKRLDKIEKRLKSNVDNVELQKRIVELETDFDGLNTILGNGKD